MFQFFQVHSPIPSSYSLLLLKRTFLKTRAFTPVLEVNHRHQVNNLDAKIYPEEIMGKRSKRSKAIQEPSRSSDHSSKVSKSRMTSSNQMEKYKKYLLQHEEKFSSDINHLTSKKKKPASSSTTTSTVDESNNIITFRPKLVLDYRHSSVPHSVVQSSTSTKDSDIHVSDSISKDDSKWTYINDNSTNDRSELDFSVLCYNILSDQLMKWHPELYVKCRKEDLDWTVRWEGIKRQMELLQWPDVICLQEVQFRNPNHAEELIIPFLSSHGYQYVMKTKTGDKVDGCLTAFKKDKFQLEESSDVEYKVDRVSVLDRDNVGLILKLSPRTSSPDHPPSSVIVANTHLLYNPKRGDIRLCQTALLLAEIDRLQTSSSTPVIVTGDLNSDPWSPVVRLLTSGRFAYSGSMLGRKAKRPAPHKLLPDSLGLSDSCQWLVSLQQRGHEANYVSGSGSFWHNLNLRTVFSDTNSVSTYQDGWTMVDHILYSAQSDKLRLRGRRELPVGEDMRNSPRIPSSQNPSDHLPLVAKFSLKL